MTTDALWKMGAIETARRIAARDVSAVDVVQSHLERLDAVNPILNAVTRPLAESARAAADQADRQLARSEKLGPLHGVPVTIKDNIDIAGQSSPNGLAVLDDVMAPANSPLVDNLLAAGAIPVGRTNTPEFSLRWHTSNPLFGATLNPWDAQWTPGGSSGGASASLAAGVGCIAHGNDLGGSLRYPAYCTGLATIRPTQGRIPAFNPSATAERPPITLQMSTQGPIARTVADVRLGLEVMAGGDPRDPWWVPAPLSGPDQAQPVRVAMVTDPPGTPLDPEVATAIRRAGQFLDEAGYQVDEVAPPEIERCAEVWAGILMVETRALMLPDMLKYGSADIQRSIDCFDRFTPRTDLEGYLRLAGERTRLARAWMTFFENYPLVVGPVSNIVPFAPDSDVGALDDVERIFRSMRLLVAVNLLGMPSAAVCTGLEDGRPTGVQIIAGRYREDLCLDAAQAIEDRVGTLTPIDPRSAR